jgi:hypothetical protein
MLCFLAGINIREDHLFDSKVSNIIPLLVSQVGLLHSFFYSLLSIMAPCFLKHEASPLRDTLKPITGPSRISTRCPGLNGQPFYHSKVSTPMADMATNAELAAAKSE